jgi:hypothetical protein
MRDRALSITVAALFASLILQPAFSQQQPNAFRQVAELWLSCADAGDVEKCARVSSERLRVELPKLIEAKNSLGQVASREFVEAGIVSGATVLMFRTTYESSATASSDQPPNQKQYCEYIALRALPPAGVVATAYHVFQQPVSNAKLVELYGLGQFRWSAPR